MFKTNKTDTTGKTNGKEISFRRLCLALAGFAVSFALIAFTPLKYLIPGYPDAELRNRMVQNELRLDSLQRSLYRWDLYSKNLRAVLEGGDAVGIDSLVRLAEKQYPAGSEQRSALADSALRARVDSEERQSLSDGRQSGQEDDGIHFFKPLNGVVSAGYDVASHPYLDISAPEGSTVNSVLDGTVVYTEWTEKDSWCMVIQHESGFISIYKHNMKLLKDVSDKVSAGTSIALLGPSSPDSERGARLHFELWKGGERVNPSSFIKF